MSNEDKNLEKETGSCNRHHKITIIIDKIIQYVVLFIVIYVFIINTVIYINHIFTLPINRFNFQVANYDMTYRILKDFNSCRLGKTYIAYGLRYILFKQYNHIVKTGESNIYENIGTFYNIHKDFLYLTSHYNNDNSNLYKKYKKAYLFTIDNILSDYTNRNVTKNHLLEEIKKREHIKFQVYDPIKNEYYETKNMIHRLMVGQQHMILDNGDILFKCFYRLPGKTVCRLGFNPTSSGNELKTKLKKAA